MNKKLAILVIVFSGIAALGYLYMVNNKKNEILP